MIEIKCRFTGRVLYSHEGDNLKIAVVAAVAARAKLAGANLARAKLAGANLGGANLGGANLGGANLGGANLGGANLGGAYLGGANIDGGEVATGDRPVLQVGPIGSRSAYLIAWLTRNGVFIRAGCFWGTRDQFAAKVKETHGDNIHAQEYEAALSLIDAHARLWGAAKTGEV